MTPFKLLAATIAARILDRAANFEAYGPRDNEEADEEGRLWFCAADPLNSDAVEIAPPGFGFSFEMWRPEATTDEEAESQFSDERHDAEDIARSIAFGIIAARRIAARKIARARYHSAARIASICHRVRLERHRKSGGTEARRADFAAERIRKMCRLDYIAALKAERQPIQ